MVYRTRAWRRHQDRRNVGRWQAFLHSIVFYRPDEQAEIKAKTFWTFETGRLRKYTYSCDCSMCELYRAETSFRYHKRKFYRQRDRWEEGKW